jgi:hypothetical protein
MYLSFTLHYGRLYQRQAKLSVQRLSFYTTSRLLSTGRQGADSATSLSTYGKYVASASTNPPSFASQLTDEDLDIAPRGKPPQQQSPPPPPPQQSTPPPPPPPLLLPPHSNVITLYERTNPQTTLLRSGFLVSSFHTLYWIWYGNSFVPAMNASPMATFHIHPLIPTVGTVMAIVIQTIFVVYPKRLIHKLAYDMGTNQLHVYSYRLPWMTIHPDKPSFTVSVADLKVNITSNQAARLVQSFQGPTNDTVATSVKDKTTSTHANDTSAKSKVGTDLSQFEVVPQILHVTWPNSGWPPYFMDIREASDVPYPDLLLQALFQSRVRVQTQNEDDDSTVRNRPRRPSSRSFQKRKRHR